MGVEFEAVLTSGTTELVSGADTYAQEGPMTTFFRTDGGRGRVDSWAVRVASIRTSELLLVRRRAAPAGTGLTQVTGRAGAAGFAGLGLTA
jgi:hypothetical protein